MSKKIVYWTTLFFVHFCESFSPISCLIISLIFCLIFCLISCPFFCPVVPFFVWFFVQFSGWEFFQWKCEFHLQVFRRIRQFQEIQGNIFPAILNFEERERKRENFSTRWHFPWKFPKVFGKWQTPLSSLKWE